MTSKRKRDSTLIEPPAKRSTTFDEVLLDRAKNPRFINELTLDNINNITSIGTLYSLWWGGIHDYLEKIKEISDFTSSAFILAAKDLELTDDQIREKIEQLLASVEISMKKIEKDPITDSMDSLLGETATDFFNNFFGQGIIGQVIRGTKEKNGKLVAIDWRNTYEQATPGQQCNAVINQGIMRNKQPSTPWDTCYICLKQIDDGQNGSHMTAQCEHILDAFSALGFRALIQKNYRQWTDKYYKLINTNITNLNVNEKLKISKQLNELETQLNKFFYEYANSHACCNQVKSRDQWIKWDKSKTKYEVNEQMLSYTLTNIQNVPSSKWDCGAVGAFKTPPTVEQQIVYIKDKYLNPLLTIINDDIQNINTSNEQDSNTLKNIKFMLYFRIVQLQTINNNWENAITSYILGQKNFVEKKQTENTAKKYVVFGGENCRKWFEEILINNDTIKTLFKPNDPPTDPPKIAVIYKLFSNKDMKFSPRSQTLIYLSDTIYRNCMFLHIEKVYERIKNNLSSQYAEESIDHEILAKFNEDLNNSIKNLYNDVLIPYMVTSSDDFVTREDKWKNELDRFIAEQEGKLKELFDENRPPDNDNIGAAQSISEMAGGDPTKTHEDILESIFDILYRYFKEDGDYTIEIQDKIKLLPSKNAKLIQNMNNFVNYIEKTEYLEAQKLQINRQLQSEPQVQQSKNVYLTKINQLLSNVIPYLDEQLDIYLTTPPVKTLQRRTLKKRISDAPEFNIYISIVEAYLNQKELAKRQDLVIYLAEKLQKYIAQILEKPQLENFERIVAKKMEIKLHNKTIKRQPTYLKPTHSSSLKNTPKSLIPYRPRSLKMGGKKSKTLKKYKTHK